MPDREKTIKRLEHLSEWLFHLYQVVCDGDAPDYYDAYKTVDDAIDLLKNQEETIASLQGTICKLNAALKEQPIKGATWICHMYTPGSKRFECNRCRGAEWKPSDYCPECGAKMDKTVVNIDD